MSEKIYAFLLMLYPEHFRLKYGEEALHLVRERSRSEKGFRSGLRLWLDLLVDFAISLPREYSERPITPMLTTPLGNSGASFQLLAERSLNPAVLFIGGMFSATIFWACVISIAHTRTFPPLFRDPLSLQALVQGDLVLARSTSEEEPGTPARDALTVSPGTHSFCITANRDIPANSVQPLFTFDFAPPGASGVVLIDGKIVKRFRNEQDLSIRGGLSSGEHQFALHLEGPAGNTSMSRNDDLKYCPPK